MMVCKQCKAEVEGGAKFCTSCGVPLGVICDRCGSANLPHDRFCASCGLALVASLSVESAPSARLKTEVIDPGSMRQYTPDEIDELLSLRRTMKLEEPSSKSLSQSEIDKLFK